jgi:hypothetical protein
MSANNQRITSPTIDSSRIRRVSGYGRQRPFRLHCTSAPLAEQVPGGRYYLCAFYTLTAHPRCVARWAVSSSHLSYRSEAALNVPSGYWCWKRCGGGRAVGCDQMPTPVGDRKAE